MQCCCRLPLPGRCQSHWALSSTLRHAPFCHLETSPDRNKGSEHPGQVSASNPASACSVVETGDAAQLKHIPGTQVPRDTKHMHIAPRPEHTSNLLPTKGCSNAMSRALPCPPAPGCNGSLQHCSPHCDTVPQPLLADTDNTVAPGPAVGTQCTAMGRLGAPVAASVWCLTGCPRHPPAHSCKCKVGAGASTQLLRRAAKEGRGSGSSTVPTVRTGEVRCSQIPQGQPRSAAPAAWQHPGKGAPI